jgi:uncharacterized RDD family membrane protein YckC
MGPPPGMEFGGFGRRLVGYIIDIIVVGVVPGLVVLFTVAGSTLSSYINAANSAAQSGGTAPQLVLPYSYYLVSGVVSVALGMLYWGLLVGAWGHTVGQAAMGLRVVRTEAPTERLPADRALLRAVPWWGGGVLGLVGVETLSAVAGLLVLLALLWVAWDPRRQGLHDKIASALVVRQAPVFASGAPGYPGGGYSPPPPPPNLPS